MEHTKLPWYIDDSVDIRRCPDSLVCTCQGSGISFAEDIANAEYIVRACNAFPELMTIIEDVIRETDKKGMFANALMIDRAKTVFAKATGKG